MKTISRYIMTLALLITAASGAWAEDPNAVTAAEINADLYSGWSSMDGSLLKASELPGFQAVTENQAKSWAGVPSTGMVKLYYEFVADGHVKYVIFENGVYKGSYENDELERYLIWEDIVYNGSTKYFYTTGPAPASGIEVTTNAEEGETTFTEATFQMPAFDATAEYELVRDMSIQMQAQVGTDPEAQPRYRVKKDGNNKFIPADMEITAVPALFTVIDGIENNKVLTQTQDYIVHIYPVDEQTGQPTGEAMTLATFTFEPGIYAVKAVAAQGSDYDGETALSNTFKLFQGYEVEVAAKEFITYYKDEPLYADTETSADAELYTIQSVSADQATLSAAIQTAPSLTPLLIFNNSDQDKTFLLIPANEEPNLQLTVAPEFQGTLTGTTIAASTEGQTNYALNGKQFVFVKNAIEVGPNKAWLEVPTGVLTARRLTITFGDGNTTGIDAIDNGQLTIDNWYDLNGRKLQGMPTKKGVYIMNGRKVVIR